MDAENFSVLVKFQFENFLPTSALQAVPSQQSLALLSK
jgi:hypothetical protein